MDLCRSHSLQARSWPLWRCTATYTDAVMPSPSFVRNSNWSSKAPLPSAECIVCSRNRRSQGSSFAIPHAFSKNRKMRRRNLRKMPRFSKKCLGPLASIDGGCAACVRFCTSNLRYELRDFNDRFRHFYWRRRALALPTSAPLCCRRHPAGGGRLRPAAPRPHALSDHSLDRHRHIFWHLSNRPLLSVPAIQRARLEEPA